MGMVSTHIIVSLHRACWGNPLQPYRSRSPPLIVLGRAQIISVFVPPTSAITECHTKCEVLAVFVP